MSQKFLRLTPLKEEYNSEDEEDNDEPRKISPFINRRHSIKDVTYNEINLDLSANYSNKLRNSLQSPKKIRNSVKLISQRIIFNKSTSSKVDLCLYAMEYQPSKRNQEMINHIKSYLKSMPSFMNVLSKEQNTSISENLIEQISIHLKHEYIPKNNLVCRFGERGEKFYIILKGKITFLVPKMMKCYLNFEEYINYLMQLRKNDEFEILNNLLAQNRIVYPIEDDNFDGYLINEYEEYQRYMHKNQRKKVKSKTGKDVFKINFNIKAVKPEQKKSEPNATNTNNDYELNTNLKLNLKLGERPSIKRVTMNVNNTPRDDDEPKKNFFSFQTYKKMAVLVDKIRQSRTSIINTENNTNTKRYIEGENSPKMYLKSNNVPYRELDPNGRKLINIYHYEEMSTFESGQTFGFIALQSKSCKRASTAIVVEDSDLGVLNKEEYLEFFEMISTKEKKNLYEMLKYYNLITSVSEYKFIKRFYHMFEYRKYYKNNNILEINKPFRELQVFSKGLFMIYINVNIPELNNLITRIKIIRGKLLGLSKYKIERSLEEKRENQDLIIRRNYMSEKESKILLKKYNYTISIISDHLILGYSDTVDPLTQMPLFNCVCTSAECDGYSITNKSIGLINQDSVVIHSLNEFCLMKMEYNLTRLKQFKKEILSKIKENELSSLVEDQEKKDNTGDNNNIYNENKNNENNKDNGEINIKTNNLFLDKFNYINRNELNIFKRLNNNIKKLLKNKINRDKIETAKNIISKSKNEEMKNTTTEKNKKILYNNNIISRNIKLSNEIPFDNGFKTKDAKDSATITKLRQSILNKQKKVELNPENNNLQLNTKKENNPYNITIIKHSLSSVAFNNKKKEQNNTDIKSIINNKIIKKQKFSNLNIFKSYLNDLDLINSLNNKLLSPLLAKSSARILPNIKKKNKNLKKVIKEKLKTENETPKKYEKNITEELLKIDQLSFVKEKFLVFKTNKKEKYNTINSDFLPKIKHEQNKPLKIKKIFFSGLSKELIDNNKNNNEKNEIKDFIDKESKKIKNSKSFQPKVDNKQNSVQKNINDKYNELNILVNSMHNLTKEILSKKK